MSPESQAHRDRVFSALDVDDSKALSRQETGGLVAVEPGYIVVTRMIPVVATAEVGSQMLSEMDQNQDRQISRLSTCSTASSSSRRRRSRLAAR